MVKKLAYIFIFLSVIITVSHSIINHYHHFETAVAESHHHHDNGGDQGHSLFSFGQIDESYIQSNNQLNLNNNFVFLFIVHTFINLELIGDTDKQEFSIAEDYPPSDNPFSKSHSLRGPPIS